MIADLCSTGAGASAIRCCAAGAGRNVRRCSFFTSNRGLAGAFNANLIREARASSHGSRRDGAAVDLHVVGRKGVGFFRYVGRSGHVERTDIGDRPTADDAARSSMADRRLREGEVDAVYVVYAQFSSALSTPPAAMQLLPVEPPRADARPRAADYIL